MTTLLADPITSVSDTSSQRLRTTMAAMRLSFTWFGVHKSLNAQQKAEAAEAFGADGDVLSAGKRLINTKHRKYQAVTALRNRALSYWKALSLPFPEPGIRLVRRDHVDSIDAKMRAFRGELLEQVDELDHHYDELKLAARIRLGRLYNENDYPVSLVGLFDMNWDWPSVEPPPYLRQLSPSLYQEECRRAEARFDEAVRLAEDAFVEELSQLVSHLTERLSGNDDGRPKIFRDSAVDNLTTFFGRFRELNIRSSAELDDLVDQAQSVVRGVQPQQLREDGSLRQRVAARLSGVQSVLDDLLVDRPRRNILRRPK